MPTSVSRIRIQIGFTSYLQYCIDDTTCQKTCQTFGLIPQLLTQCTDNTLWYALKDIKRILHIYYSTIFRDV